MYRLKWQEESHDGWGRVHQVLGDINAVHSIYLTLTMHSRHKADDLGLNAEIRALSTKEDDGTIVYQWGQSLAAKNKNVITLMPFGNEPREK